MPTIQDDGLILGHGTVLMRMDRTGHSGKRLMLRADETFITSNPQHLAVARDIQAALAPLNALPWPLDEEGDNASPRS